MALANYTDLQGAVAGWLHREDDDELVARVPDFIALGEARIARQLRLRRMMTTATINTAAASQTVALPADFLQAKRLRLASPDRVLDFLPGRAMAGAYPLAYSGPPRHYAIEGSNLVLAPVPDAAGQIECVYYARVPALSATPTNWLLLEHPGLYLWSALAEAAPFLRDASMVATWEGKFSAEVEDAKAADKAASSSGSGLRIRPR